MHNFERAIELEGAFNVRDLGGLKTRAGTFTRARSLFRSDAVNGFTAQDWQKIVDLGIRTVIDLRHAHEQKADRSPRPAEVQTRHVPIEIKDEEFWRKWSQHGHWGTPLYYHAHFERFPDRHALVVRAIAEAPRGGVLFHCAAGRDRTGIVSLVLLSLAGVEIEEMISDYHLSLDNLTHYYAASGLPDEKIASLALIEKEGRTIPEIIRTTLDAVDVETLLLQNGCAQEHITAIRDRLNERIVPGSVT